MKILTITATPFFSDRGCHMRVYNEAKFLQKFGAEVKICTYHYGKNIEGFDIERLKNVKWYRRTAPGFSWGKFWLDLKLIFLCRRVIRDFGPDIIHAHLYEGLGVGYVAKKLAFRGSIPIVFDLQGDLEEEFRAYNKEEVLARRIFVWLSKIFISRSDWLVLSSENMLPKIEKIFPHKGRLFVVKDGVDTDMFREIPELAEKEREKIDEISEWKGGRKLLVYIGGLSDNKGVGELLSAFHDFSAQNNKWALLVGGFGSDEEKYKRFIGENNLGGKIYFSGKVEYFSLPAYMSLANAAIDPKNMSSESSGKIVNLMATRLPIVCFDNEFNRSRLGEKGYYMKNFSELGETLAKINGGEKIEYDTENISQGGEVKKLMSIFRLLTK
ncbi:MAG: glycosyltransferase [Candidatus Moranbacteria bacterium]|nr:glycosyltransferase [Candidatus Moranbacteria bacterium]